MPSTHPPRLTAAEERTLASRWRRDRDQAALDELVERNLGLAHHVARTFGRYGIPFADRLQTARLALVVAARSFDPSRGARLGTFAHRLIRCALIEMASRATRSGVSIGNAGHRRLAVLGLSRVLKKMSEDGVEVTGEALAARTGVSAAIAGAINAAARPPVELDRARGDGPAMEFASDEPSAEEQLIGHERQRELAAALSAIGERDREIVKAICGDAEPAKCVARRLGMTRAEVLERAERSRRALLILLTASEANQNPNGKGG